MKNINRRSDCPISYALDFFGDKWTFLIIRDMVFKGKKFYKEFLNAEESIATNILSDRLKKLEAIDVIQSQIYEERKTQKLYQLTQKGKDLIPILVEMVVWSAQYDKQTAADMEFVERAKSDKKRLIETINESLK